MKYTRYEVESMSLFYEPQQEQLRIGRERDRKKGTDLKWKNSKLNEPSLRMLSKIKNLIKKDPLLIHQPAKRSELR